MSHSRPTFGPERELEAWLRECNELGLKMTTEYCVAPRCSVLRVDGSVLSAGEAVSVDDFYPVITPTETVSPYKQLQRAIRDGAVLVRGRRYPMQSDGPTAA